MTEYQSLFFFVSTSCIYLIKSFAMRLSTFVTISSLAASALAAPAPVITPRAAIAQPPPLEKRTGTTPTPTGSLCAKATPTPAPLDDTALVNAIIGCEGVQSLGTNFTRNDIVNGECKPFTLLFARGTTEDPTLGNLVGPPLVFALNKTFGAENVAVQGLNNYPGDEPEFCAGGSPEGSKELAQVSLSSRLSLFRDDD